MSARPYRVESFTTHEHLRKPSHCDGIVASYGSIEAARRGVLKAFKHPAVRSMGWRILMRIDDTRSGATEWYGYPPEWTFQGEREVVRLDPSRDFDRMAP